VSYLSASAVVIHYEEALYQVYVPLSYLYYYYYHQHYYHYYRFCLSCQFSWLCLPMNPCEARRLSLSAV